MKRIILALCLSLCTVAVVFAAEGGKADPRSMSFPELRFQIPRAERIVLTCGMPVYLLADRELPIISMTALVRTGSVYDPANRSGLATLTGSAMRNGGAAGMSAEKMDDELEFMASTVESAIAQDMGTVSLSSLTRNFNQTLRIFRDVLLHPDFCDKRLELIRRQMIEGLRRQNDDPKEIADREIARAIYAGHPLGAVPSFASVTAITRQEVVDFHRRFFRVDNMILAVSGDFERTALIRQLNEVFGPRRPTAPLSVDKIPQPPAIFRPEVLHGKKSVNQSVIRMGHLGPTKDDPDIHAVRILDYILGGSFTSRLTMEIRTNRGLAYSAGSHFDIGRRFSGSFIAETETKAESTAKAISLMREIITTMTREEVSDQELKSAQEYIINSFMFGFTSPAAVAIQRARLEYYGYPIDYLETYRDSIARVTKRDVLSAARTYLKPEAFKIVVIGDAKSFDKPLTTFGAVRELDLSQSVPAN
ncbi:M16 family metallopeptidase [Pelobacter propionicus]|uniref:Peptidase M16 domain protein n=1 Tax=Pelobacter propionicus (strain DSM 2379 / NBRC 103807 / OttBd1) TaxID=338966 RepID=A1ATY9_PELPD|nr:pitrilysin family protein [Pelobacter propionicus]ABL00810.1 peptidase M16 domain protein [Pelobacter propionicus DSM 2379]